MSYCTVDDVCTAFPRFVRNAANSIQDTQIQDWIDDRKARIRSAFLARLIDPDTLALTVDAGNFLRALNRDGAIADLGDALQGDVTLQPGEYSLAGSHRQSFERQINEIKEGLYDALFSGLARHVEIEPLLGGTAGGETDRSTASDRGEDKAFSKNQVF
ncbi:MAG: hypothetical protein WCD04_16335 [Terriglobia bacterium]|jgi:hypothetical protein